MEASAHALAGGVGSAAAMALLYPLERCRIILQVKSHAETSYSSLPQTMLFILRSEGPIGLYRGLLSALFGVGVSSAVYFYWYSLLKKMVSFHSKILTPSNNMMVAAVAGIINVVLTTPIWVIQTRMACSHNKATVMKILLRTIQQEGFIGLYKGLIPALILVANPAIQFVAYEQLMNALRNIRQRQTSNPSASLSSVEILLLGALAKALATFITYPYQLIKSRMQANDYDAINSDEKDLSVVSAFMKIKREEGVTGLYTGLSTKMCQTVLNSAIMFLIYEKMFSTFLIILRTAQQKRTVRV